jgi:hypothetical protein
LLEIFSKTACDFAELSSVATLSEVLVKNSSAWSFPTPLDGRKEGEKNGPKADKCSKLSPVHDPTPPLVRLIPSGPGIHGAYI